MSALPRLTGRAIRVRDARQLVARRGKLFSGDAKRGKPVHAASFLRERAIILDTQLLARPRLLRLILLHEVFHFVWARLANRKRQQFAQILRRELESGARAEIGESSAVQKELLLRRAGVSGHGRGWREYVCESFCDTAAWLYSGRRADRRCGLAKCWRDRRERWFRAAFDTGCRC